MTREYQGIYLTESFEDSPQGRARAEKVLQHYFTPLSKKNTGYTGGVWDTFDPSGTRQATTNEFTAEDLVACALLSAPISGRAAVELLERRKRHFTALLERVGPDREFIEAGEPGSASHTALDELFWELRDLPGVGLTRTTKLLARKRPRLVPIVDGVIKRVVFDGGPGYWGPLYRALTAEDRRLWRQLEGLKTRAGLLDEIPVVRVFDVLAWMDGTGNSARVVTGGGEDF